MQYIVVSGQSETVYEAIEELEKKVRKLCEEGWRPQGGISIAFTYFDKCVVCQAMVK